jgi:hypothetical protein
VVAPLAQDELVVRLRDISRTTLARSYDILDPQQRQLAKVVQKSGNAATVVRRQLAGSPLGLTETYEMLDGDAVVVRIARHRRGRPKRALVVEVGLADDTPLCTAESASGADGPYTILGPDSTRLGDVARGGRTLFVVTAATGSPLGRIDTESSTYTPQQAGTAHTSSYRVRFHADTPTPVRMGTLAVLVAFDSMQGP